MITLPMGILLLGLGVLGLAVATAIHDTWWLQRKVEEAGRSSGGPYEKLPKADFVCISQTREQTLDPASRAYVSLNSVFPPKAVESSEW